MEKKAPLILLVDDEKDFLEIFATKLMAAGFEVVGAMSGEDALESLKQVKPDLILLDVQMPGLNGVDTLSKIKSDPGFKNTKVAFLTNYGEPLPVKELLENDKKFAKEIGAMDYIKKSDDLDDVVKHVKDILSGPVKDSS